MNFNVSFTLDPFLCNSTVFDQDPLSHDEGIPNNNLLSEPCTVVVFVLETFIYDGNYIFSLNYLKKKKHGRRLIFVSLR